MDAAPVHGHRQRLRPQPRSPALRAGDLPHVGLDLAAGPVGLGVGVAPLQPGDDALEGGAVGAGPPVAVLVLDVHLLGARAVEHGLLLGLLELGPGGAQAEPVGLGQRRQHPVEVLGAGGDEGGDRPLGQRQVGIGHHQLGVDLVAGTQAVAVGAGAVGRVEREVAGRQLVEREPAGGAGQVLAEGQDHRAVAGLAVGLAARDELDFGHPLGQAQRRLQ